MLNSLASAASAVLSGAASVVGVRSGTEEPQYEVLSQQGDVEIRRYPPRLAAETTIAAATATVARSEGFRRLAGYIFGANRGGAKIAMTAPVTQAPAGTQSEKIAMTAPVATEQAGPGRWTIRFFMPSCYTRDSLPQPKDPQVTIVDVPAEIVAALRYSGVPSQAAAAEHRGTLLATLTAGGWAPAGEPADWFYDPPWTIPPLRRNEAVVAVAPR